MALQLSSRSIHRLLLALTLSLSACGEGLLEGARDLGPVALSLGSASLPAEEPELIATLRASPEVLKQWSFFDAEASWVEGEDGGSILLEQLGTSAAFEIPVEIGRGTVNQVVVHLENNKRTELAAILNKGGEAQLRTKTILQPTTRTPTSVILDLSTAQTLGGSPREGSDSVRILCGSQSATVNVHGVDLLWIPPESYLPMPSQVPSIGEPVELGGEYRTALCLQGGQPVTGRAKIPSGAELRFSFGVPRQTRITGASGSLSVSVLAEKMDPIVGTYAIEIEGRSGSLWTDQVMDLGPLGGREVQLEIEYLPTGSADGLLAMSTPRLVEPSEEPRHVVLITSDTHRADHLGVAGEGVEIRTPFLDGLAANGVYFSDCFSTSNITVPSHAAIMTGLSPKEVGIIDNTTALSGGANTLAEAFREAGYYTAAVLSTMHLGHENSGLGQGFDRMFTSTEAKQVGQISIEDVKEVFRSEGDQQVFLWLHLFDAHAPYLPPDEYRHEYYPRDRDPYSQGTGITDRNRASWDKRIRDLEFILSQYKSEITYLDAMLAEVFDTPSFEDSIIAFTADHGESLGGQGIYFKHRGLYNSTIDIPLLMRWPGGPRGLKVETPVQNIDLGRTLLDLAGLQAAEFAGESLLSKLEPEAGSSPRFVIGSHGHQASLEQGGWLCVLTIQATTDFPGKVKHQVELFDLSADSACEHDLLEAEFERAKVMRRALIEWLAKGRREDLALVRDQRSVELLNTIAALGYTTSSGEIGGPYYEEDPEDEWCERFR